MIRDHINLLRNGQDPMWHSFFLFIDEERRQAIGSSGFWGPPINGRVVFGYGVAPTFQGNGVATAAVRLMLDMAFEYPAITEVFAETGVDNIASRRVVEKNGLTHIGQRQSEEHGLVDQWLIHRPQ
jgi:RimJ/RimL family protein N-acetyltransferase